MAKSSRFECRAWLLSRHQEEQHYVKKIARGVARIKSIGLEPCAPFGDFFQAEPLLVIIPTVVTVVVIVFSSLADRQQTAQKVSFWTRTHPSIRYFLLT